MKKKIFALAMTMVMTLAMVACGNNTSIPAPMMGVETETTEEVAEAVTGAAIGSAIARVDLTPASTAVNTATQATVGHVLHVLSMFVRLMQDGAAAGTESTNDDAEAIADTMNEMAGEMADILDEMQTKESVGDDIPSKNDKPVMSQTKESTDDGVPSKDDKQIVE